MTTAVKNDRLKKRFEKWDVNGNGKIEKSDFEAEAGRIINAFGEDPASPQARAVKDSFVAMYEYLASKAGLKPERRAEREAVHRGHRGADLPGG